MLAPLVRTDMYLSCNFAHLDFLVEAFLCSEPENHVSPAKFHLIYCIRDFASQLVSTLICKGSLIWSHM